jgi:hypothetical protein
VLLDPQVVRGRARARSAVDLAQERVRDLVQALALDQAQAGRDGQELVTWLGAVDQALGN